MTLDRSALTPVFLKRALFFVEDNLNFKRKLRIIPLILIFLTGLFMSIGVFISLQDWEKEQAQRLLERQASGHVKALKQSLTALNSNMEAIKKLYELNNKVSENVFSAFIDQGLVRQGGIKALEWIPMVSNLQRNSITQDARRSGIFDYMIRSYDQPYAPIETKSIYFPIRYAEPKSQNGDNLGMDLHSHPLFKTAMLKALSTRSHYATEPVQIESADQERYQIRIFLPVLHTDNQQLKGYIAGLIHIDDLIESVIGDPEQSLNFNLNIVEVSQSNAQVEIYRSSWRDRNNSSPHFNFHLPSWSQELLVAQKKWRLDFTLPKSGLEHSYLSYVALTLGLILTFVLVWYLHNAHRHMKRVEDLVALKTKSLYESNNSLQKEIAERERIEKKLFINAYHDPLTQCLNRRAFNEQLDKRFETAQRLNDWNFAVLFIDLDRLKYVNDTYGHNAGDLVISETAERIQKQIRQNDKMARLGGDEFAIILEHVTHIEKAEDVAERVLHVLRKPFELGQEQFITSGSVGVALAHELYDTPTEILRDSDTAMYHAKNAGRNQHAIFSPEMYLKAKRHMQLQSELNKALENQEFNLLFQPIYEASTNRIISMEALIRWQHPTLGMVSPLEFIPLAEELGLIHEIGHWVINQSLKNLHAVHQQTQRRDISVNINVSPLQLLRPELIGKIKSALCQNQIPSQLCKIEITETALGSTVEDAANLLRKLKQTGVQILVDDFGTGHASLNHLNVFPIDGLKIDRSFITDIELDATKLKIVETIIQLKDILNLDITAEGIENTFQKEILRKLKCTHLQGYLCGKPMPLGQILLALKSEEKQEAKQSKCNRAAFYSTSLI